jgi:hypothetical protein
MELSQQEKILAVLASAKGMKISAILEECGATAGVYEYLLKRSVEEMGNERSLSKITFDLLTDMVRNGMIAEDQSATVLPLLFVALKLAEKFYAAAEMYTLAAEDTIATMAKFDASIALLKKIIPHKENGEGDCERCPARDVCHPGAGPGSYHCSHNGTC